MALRVVPVLGAAARVLADRMLGRGPATAPPGWVTLLAVVAVGLWLGTFWTFMGIEQIGVEYLPYIGWIVGGPVAGSCAWIVASHVAGGRDRHRQLADVVLVVLVVAVVIALLAWFAVPGVSLVTFPAAERGRLSAFGFPTPTGVGLAVALPFAFAAAWRRRPWMAIVLAVVVVVAIILTESRGPLLALAAGATVALWLLGRLNRRTVGLLAVAGAIGMVAVMVARYGTNPSEIIDSTAAYLLAGGDADRIETWWAAVDVALKDPLTGGGWHALARWGDGSLAAGQTIQAHNVILRCTDDLGGATADFLHDRDTALMAGSRADGAPIYAPEWLDIAALLGTRPRACRPYRAQTKGKVERIIREVKHDFLAWLAGQPLPERPTLAWYDAQARAWATGVQARRRHRTTKQIVGEAWEAERPLLVPVSSRLVARMEGADTLVPLPAPASARRMPAAAGETVEVRPLAVYAELAR